jgi:hypothetical protein
VIAADLTPGPSKEHNKGEVHVKNLAARIACLAGMAIASFGMDSTNGFSPFHTAGMSLKITTRDGSARIVKLEGVGCTLSICSRTMMKAKAERDALMKLSLDGIAAIRDTADHDALFVMRDGTQKRLTLVKDFRVLYFADSGHSERLGIENVKSIDFLRVTH